MTKSGQLWGGRFTEKPDETFAEFNDSYSFDRRLFAADVQASIAHANGLGAGVLTADEALAIVGGLNNICSKQSRNATFFDGSDAEDVHSFIEGKLIGLDRRYRPQTAHRPQPQRSGRDGISALAAGRDRYDLGPGSRSAIGSC